MKQHCPLGTVLAQEEWIFELMLRKWWAEAHGEGRHRDQYLRYTINKDTPHRFQKPLRQHSLLGENRAIAIERTVG